METRNQKQFFIVILFKKTEYFQALKITVLLVYNFQNVQTLNAEDVLLYFTKYINHAGQESTMSGKTFC